MSMMLVANVVVNLFFCAKGAKTKMAEVVVNVVVNVSVVNLSCGKPFLW